MAGLSVDTVQHALNLLLERVDVKCFPSHNWLRLLLLFPPQLSNSTHSLSGLYPRAPNVSYSPGGPGSSTDTLFGERNCLRQDVYPLWGPVA